MFVAHTKNVMSNPKTIAAIKARQSPKRIDRIEDQLRETERRLDELIEQHRRDRERMGYEVGKLSDSAQRQMNCQYTLKYILSWVCKLHGVTVTEMSSIRRNRKIVHARQAYCYWAKNLTPCSYPQIGKYIDKDHTTAIHSARVYIRNRKKIREYLRCNNFSKPNWWQS